MKKLKYLFFFILLFTTTGISQSEHFGKVKLQIDDQEEQDCFVKSILLYQNVAVDYDTALHVRSIDDTELYYSPQLAKGNNYVLHILLSLEGKEETGKTSVYDIYFDLGDTLSEEIEILDADSNAFLYASGRLTSKKLYSRHQNGIFKIVRDPAGLGVSGSFNVEFEYPLSGEVNEYDHVKMSGELSIPEENLRRGDTTSITEVESQNRNYKRNIIIAVITSVMIILLALR